MNNKIINVLMFAAGTAIGSIVTWQLVKRKYEQIAQEEIDSVKEVFSKRMNPCTKTGSVSKIDGPEEDDSSNEVYKDIIKESGYTSNEDEDEVIETDLTEEVNNHAEKPYVIPPDEFGEYYGYDIVSLTLYADMILADENNEIIEDVEDSVGFESLGHFGEYEDDAVHVRNERYGCDYEILRDLRKYTDVVKKPHQTEE